MMRKGMPTRLLLSVVFVSPLIASAKPLQLEYQSSPELLAAPSPLKTDEKSMTFSLPEPAIKAGTECDSGYCTRKAAPFPTDSQRIHRTDRRRQSDAFSTNQDGNGKVFIGGSW
ncbi:hypothetical protein [Pantoea sp.]|nr:hypothetical protein [Pantoea sp.]